jgi:glycosyltransferase involved in cell wall biosynthesis
MTAGAPAIVNAVCGATREHCERSGAGMWFDGFAEFESVVERMTGDAALHAVLQRNGRQYVEANYRWPVILERYCGALEGFARGGGVPAVADQANGVP